MEYAWWEKGRFDKRQRKDEDIIVMAFHLLEKRSSDENSCLNHDSLNDDGQQLNVRTHKERGKSQSVTDEA